MEAEAHDDTFELLRRCHAGDDQALRALVARDLDWIRARVRRRAGDVLRQHAEVSDYVHDAVVATLEHGPRFVVADKDHFRALVARIVENVLRMRHRALRAGRRDVAKERRFATGVVLDLTASGTSPSAAASRDERRAWLDLGLELLAPADREIVLLRQWEGLSFAAAAARLGVSEDAARMRFARALRRLARVVQRLRRGAREARETEP